MAAKRIAKNLTPEQEAALERGRSQPKSPEHRAKISEGMKAAHAKKQLTETQKIRREEAKAAKKSGKGRPEGTVSAAPVTPEDRVRKGPICGAPRTGKSTSGEGICCMPAGWGTDHLGYGHCRKHQGTQPSHRKAAVKEEAMAKAVIYGAPIDIDPEQAILQELCRTQGHVTWLAEQVRQVESGHILESTPFGIKPSAYLALYKDERTHLVRVAEVCKRMGIEERRMQLAEEYGKLIAMVLKGFIEDPDLGLTPLQKILSRDIARKHLMAIDAAAQMLPVGDEAVAVEAG